MSIISTSNRWLNRLYKATAILLVLLAVLISAFRLFLPYVSHYKDDLQHYINSEYQTNINIGSLVMIWQGAGPTLLLSQISALDNEQASFEINELALQIDFWRSVQKRELIYSNLILSGTEVYFDQELFQQNDSSALPNTAVKNTDFNKVANIFLNHISRFSLRDSQVIVQDKQSTRSFHINHLNWVNSEDRHQAQGTVVVNGLSSNNLQVKMDLKGASITSLTGELYLQANHIDMTPWLNKVLVLDEDKTKTDINFSAWLKVEDSAINSLQIEVGKSTISWLFADQEKSLTLAQGQLLLLNRSGERSFTMFSSPLVMEANDALAHEVTLTVTKKADDFIAHLSAIDLAVISQLPPLFIASESQQKLLQGLALKGKVDDVFIRYQQGELAVLADFSGISNDYSNGIPGIENVSGKLSFVDNYLSLNLFAEQGNLDFNRHFESPFSYQTITAQVDIELNSQGWSLTVNQLELLSEAINLSTELTLNAPKKSDMTIALLADITDGDAGMVGKYLPLSIMSKNLVTYLNQAIISGRLEQAQVLLNGPLTNFPYTDGTGIFVVNAELTDSQFKFTEDWPAITDFQANLNFTNNSMLITGRDGELMGLDVKGTKVAINDLANKQILTVDSPITAVSAKNVSQLIDQSPLKKSVGSVLTHLNVSGNISGQFDLTLPLNDLDSAVARGVINFSNNKIALKTPGIDLKNIQGQLSFINDKINTENLSLTWHDLPLNIVVSGQDKTEYFDTDIQFSANWQPNDWQSYIPKELKKYFAGNLDWQGVLSLHQHHQGGFSYEMDLNSSLVDTQLNLPIPYGKNSGTEKTLTLQVSGQLDKSKIEVELDHQLSFFGVLEHDTTSFSRAHLVIGDDTMLLPTDGFHITTKLEQADVSTWQLLISDILASINNTKKENKVIASDKYKPLFSAPERIRGTIVKLAVFAQTLNNVSFDLFDKDDWWLLHLNAKETRSQIKLYSDWLEQGIEIKSEFIHLAQNEGVTESILAEQLAEPMLAEQLVEPILAEQLVEPILAEQLAEPILAEQLAEPILAEQLAEPILAEQLAEPILAEQLAEPLDGIDNENLALDFTPTAVSNGDVFANIPPISLQCDRCQIGLLNLGKVDFTLEREKNVISVTRFTADREQANINLTATWVKNETISKTSILGDISLASVEHELALLGYDSIIRDSGGKVNFDIHWQGGPHEFDIAKLNGQYQANLDDGYLADVPDKARIFSVLSLQSLVRKLTLDFRDIFSDGMFYSSIKGDYNIQNGVLYTDNTKMDGTAGNLLMTGSTNLVDDNLDYKMTYKPNLSSSLPVMAWIVTLNPVTFLAGVAIDQVIKSQVVSELNFTLTGTVKEPRVKVVDRKMKSVTVGGTKDKVVDTPDNQIQKNNQDSLESPNLKQYKLQRDKEPKSKIERHKDNFGELNG
jgi:uncharacterized protein (TIGR02099 family)